jgi:hypothetical protein
MVPCRESRRLGGGSLTHCEESWTRSAGSSPEAPASWASTWCATCSSAGRSIDKAQRVLGWRPRFSNKQALVRNYEWYLDNLDRFRHASGVSHRVPWKQGVLRFAKIFF